MGVTSSLEAKMLELAWLKMLGPVEAGAFAVCGAAVGVANTGASLQDTLVLFTLLLLTITAGPRGSGAFEAAGVCVRPS